MANNYDAERLEAQKRFDSLPENLKKEMLADKNVQLISNLCRDYGLPEEKVKDVALIAGEVFLGYLKPAEIASELHEFFQVDLQKANFIEIELKQKMFDPLKTDLEKIYNPPKAPMETEEEVSPAKIEFAKEAAPLSSISSQPAAPASMPSPKSEPRISPLTMGTAPLKPAIPQTPAAPKAVSEQPAQIETPFIIQTKTEAAKPAMPQFPKETPSLNLKIEPSLAPKPSAPKPVSIRLETEQPVNVKFTMPVQLQNVPAAPKPVVPQPTPQPIAPKPAVIPPIIPKMPEPPRTVHYSAFKTPLTPAGMPKKPEPAKKGDMINLATFTKVSGNTVDLRSANQK